MYYTTLYCECSTVQATHHPCLGGPLDCHTPFLVNRTPYSFRQLVVMRPALGDERRFSQLIVTILFSFATNCFEMSMWFCSGLWNLMESQLRSSGERHSSLITKRGAEGDRPPFCTSVPSLPTLDLVPPRAIFESWEGGRHQPQLQSKKAGRAWASDDVIEPGCACLWRGK